MLSSQDAPTQQLDVLETIKGAAENFDMDKAKEFMSKGKDFVDKMKDNELVGKSVDLIKKMIPGAKAKFEEMGGVEGITNMITDIKDGEFTPGIVNAEGPFSNTLVFGAAASARHSSLGGRANLGANTRTFSVFVSQRDHQPRSLIRTIVSPSGEQATSTPSLSKWKRVISRMSSRASQEVSVARSGGSSNTR
jgi:hypothetical protein